MVVGIIQEFPNLKNINRNMVVRHDKKFVFTSVPKTGSKTLMLQLSLDPGVINDPPHIYHATIKDSITNLENPENYFKFGLVRHPIERFISTYMDGISDPGHIRDWSKNLLNYDSLEDFCKNFANDEIRNDIHFIPQYNFFYENDLCLADRIYRYEKFSESCTEISQKFNIHIDSSIRTRQTNRNRDFTHYLSTESIKFLSDYYKKDFEFFNYEIPFT